MVGRCLARKNEDARTDHRAYAQQDQVLGGEGALQCGFALQAALDRLAGVDMPGGLYGFDDE